MTRVVFTVKSWCVVERLSVQVQTDLGFGDEKEMTTN